MKLRAKFVIHSITRYEGKEVLQLKSMSNLGKKNQGNPNDDEADSIWTPYSYCNLTVDSPALMGRFTVGQEFYADFTPVQND